MKILITKLIGAALFLGATSLPATANTYSVTNIPADGALTLRAWPSQISKPLSSIPANTQNIEATGKTIVLDTVNWLQISYGDNTGWVESSYLTQAQHHVPKVDLNQEKNATVANKAEFFSYGETRPTAKKPTPTAKATVKTLDPNADIIANNVKYPWNVAADSIYNDPKTKSHPRPIEATAAEIPETNIASTQTTPGINQQMTSLQQTAAPVIAATGPTLQTPIAPAIPETPSAPVIQATVTNPAPVVINASSEPVDYRAEDVSGNRYEHIETAATMGFISN